MNDVNFSAFRRFTGREQWDNPQFGDNERFVTGQLFIDCEDTWFIIDELQGDCDIYNFSHCAIPVDKNTVTEVGMIPHISTKVTGYSAMGMKTHYIQTQEAHCTNCDYELGCITYGFWDMNYCESCGVKIDWSEVKNESS